MKPPKRHWYLDVLPFAVLSAFLLWLTFRKPPEDKASSILVDPARPSAPAAGEPGYVSLAERELAERGGPGLAGLVPEAPPPPHGPESPNGADIPVLRPGGGPRAYNRLVEIELKRLTKITRRYYKEEPVVREVDRAFGSLPRYMAVRRRYLQDKDAYAFAHDTIALPEVRKTIKKYATDPQVWRVTTAMIREAMKEKPPKPLYDEMKRFFTEDKKVVGLAAELSASVIPQMGTVLAEVVKPGSDLKPLTDLAKDLNIEAPPPNPKTDSKSGGAGSVAKPGVPSVPEGELKIGEGSQRDQQIREFGKGARPKNR
ncbi:MAG: hypothetical protein HYZ75_02105 [Elusimicrobia bacterium]|nr:hypothetical protein [Elusimicrobiota bacterium]